MVEKQDPERFRRLLAQAEREARQRVRVYQQLAGVTLASDSTDAAPSQPRRRPSRRWRPRTSRRTPWISRRPTSASSCRTRSCPAPRRWSTTSTPCGGSRTPAPRRSSCTRCSRSRSRREQLATFLHTEPHGESFAEALVLLPAPRSASRSGPTSTSSSSAASSAPSRVPVIASLNGTTPGGWLDYARLIEQAGADALELNVYAVPCRDPRRAPRTSRSARSRCCARVKARRSGSRSRSSCRPSTRRCRTSRSRLDAGGRRRPRALQPLLPARHRPRGAQR